MGLLSGFLEWKNVKIKISTSRVYIKIERVNLREGGMQVLVFVRFTLENNVNCE